MVQEQKTCKNWHNKHSVQSRPTQSVWASRNELGVKNAFKKCGQYDQMLRTAHFLQIQSNAVNLLSHSKFFRHRSEEDNNGKVKTPTANLL